MSSETSTKPGQVFILLSMAAATVAVMLTGQTHPVALLLLSAGVLACGLSAYFMHSALASLIAPKGKVSALSSDRRELLVWDKQRVLHSIKELEFDHRMGKVNVKDFQTLAAPLRVHAAALMEDLDRLDAEAALAAKPDVSDACPKCGTTNDPDARFCKSCGTKINGGSAATKMGTGIGAILLAAALGAAWPVTASAQIAMPDPKTVSGMPIPAAEVPAGAIQVRVIRGSWDKNIPNQPVQFLIGGKPRTVKTNDQGRAEVTGLAPGTIVKVSTVVDKETLTSQDITIGDGVRVALVATDPEAAAREEADKKLAAGPPVKGTVVLGPNTRIVVEPGDEVLTVYYVLDIVNAEKAPVDLGGPLQLNLPTGARGGGIIDGSSPQGKLLGAHLTVVGPFKPGSTEVQLGFELPTGSSTKTITQMFPVAVPETTVVLQRSVAKEDLESPQLADKQETTNQGTPILVARGTALGPGGTLSFDVTGLPHHPRWPRYLALTLAIGFLVVGVFEGFRRA